MTAILHCTTVSPVNIVVQGICNKLVVFENSADPVTTFQYRSSPAEPWVIMQKGLSLDWEGIGGRPLMRGENKGQLLTVGQDADFAQLEL